MRQVSLFVVTLLFSTATLSHRIFQELKRSVDTPTCAAVCSALRI